MSFRACSFGHLVVALLVGACGPEAPMDTDGPTSGATTTTTASTTGGSANPTTTVPGTASTPAPTTTTEDSAGSTTADSPFIVVPDFCGHVAGGELGARCLPIGCSVWDQDCPRGEKCVPYSGDGDGVWESEKCVPIAADPGQPGEPCSYEGNVAAGIDTCDRGVVCWHVPEDSLEGTCVAMCEGSPADPSCDEPTTACAMSNDGVLNLCLPACDPLASDCAAGQVCVASGDNFVCTQDASGDEGQVFDPCEFVNACDPGLLCADAMAASECDVQAIGCCLPFCDLDLPANCPGAQQECLPLFPPGEAPPGQEDLGGCLLPP